MSFETDVVKNGIGRVLCVDVSFDGFSTWAHRWGTAADVLPGSTGRQKRIVTCSPVRRGFGQNRIAASGTCQIVLDNVDGALDWLCDENEIENVAKARFRIFVALYTPGGELSTLTFTEKRLGEFTCAREWPVQNNTTITLNLADDVLGPISQQTALPTLYDWKNVPFGTTSNNPLKNAMGLPSSIDGNTAVQLAFGEDWVLAFPHIIPWQNPHYADHVIVPVCCTTDLGAVSQDDITNVRVQWMGYDINGGPGIDGQGELGVAVWRDVPRTRIVSPAYGTSAAVEETVWTVEKSPTITKDGVDFQIVYLVVRSHLGIPLLTEAASGNWDTTSYGQFAYTGGYPIPAVAWSSPDTKVTAQRVLSWYVKGSPLSARTQTTSPVQHAVDVLTDLATHYSNNPNVTVDAASAARVRAGNPNAACAGVIQSWTTGPKKGDPVTYAPPPSLRQAISEICQSADIDLFINWDGEVSFSSDVYDFTVATQTDSLISIPETAFVKGSTPTRRIPSGAERWAPYNRLFLTGGKANPAEQLDIPFQGPWPIVPGEGGIPPSARIVEGSLPQGWRPFRQQWQPPYYYRSLSPRARHVVSFRIGRQALLLDLGNYFKLTWTRGPAIRSPYADAVFQLENIAYAHADDTCEISAIWRDDVTTEKSYILDDETLAVRSKGALSGNAIPNDGDVVCDFDGTVNLTTMGVQVGDIFVMRCTTDPEDEFVANAAHRIAAVVSPTEIEVEPAFGTFVTAPIPNAQWYIIRGATTYPTAVSDPTNYPSGGALYGKVSDLNGEFSNSDPANKLISG